MKRHVSDKPTFQVAPIRSPRPTPRLATEPDCPGCGYNLHGLPREGGRVTCPECGLDTDLAQLRAVRRRHKPGRLRVDALGLWLLGAAPVLWIAFAASRGGSAFLAAAAVWVVGAAVAAQPAWRLGRWRGLMAAMAGCLLLTLYLLVIPGLILGLAFLVVMLISTALASPHPQTITVAGFNALLLLGLYLARRLDRWIDGECVQMWFNEKHRRQAEAGLDG